MDGSKKVGKDTRGPTQIKKKQVKVEKHAEDGEEDWEDESGDGGSDQNGHSEGSHPGAADQQDSEGDWGDGSPDQSSSKTASVKSHHGVTATTDIIIPDLAKPEGLLEEKVESNTPLVLAEPQPIVVEIPDIVIRSIPHLVNFHLSCEQSITKSVEISALTPNGPTTSDLLKAVFYAVERFNCVGCCVDVFLDDLHLVVREPAKIPPQSQEEGPKLQRIVSEGQKSRKSRNRSARRVESRDERLGSKKVSRQKVSVPDTDQQPTSDNQIGVTSTTAIKNEKQLIAFPSTLIETLKFGVIDVLVENPAQFHVAKTQMTKESVLPTMFTFSLNQGASIKAFTVVPSGLYLQASLYLKTKLGGSFSYVEISLPKCTAGTPVTIPLKHSLIVESGDVISCTLVPEKPFSGCVFLHHSNNHKTLGSDGTLMQFSGKIPVAAIYYTTDPTTT